MAVRGTSPEVISVRRCVSVVDVRPPPVAASACSKMSIHLRSRYASRRELLERIERGNGAAERYVTHA